MVSHPSWLGGVPSGGSTPNQTTGYVYGVGGTIGQNIFSNSLIAATEYPDPSTGQPSSSYGNEEQFGYNWQGQKTSSVMRDTTTHQYLHDVLGRLTADYVSSFGGNVDQTIQRLGYSFNEAGLPFQQTSYSDAAGTTVANQVQDAYNGYGQLTYEYQSHSGGVVVGSTLETKYTYLQPIGANYSRLSAMTYPNGQVLDYAYGVQEPISSISSSGTTATATYSGPNQFSVGDQVVINGAASGSPYNGAFTITAVNTSASTFSFTLGSSYTGSDSSADLTALKPSADPLDNAISRISAIQDHAGTYAGNDQSYQYLGLSTIVQELDANGIELTYIKQSGESNGNAGDQYTGLDRFGRVDDQRWIPVSNPNNAVDRFQYGYDRDGNVLYKNNLVNSSFSELYHVNAVPTNSSYDQLNRIVSFERGTLSASSVNGGTLDQITSPSTSNSWSYDALGNWTSTQNGSQTRTFNAQNQMTSISGQSSSFYENGDMVSDPLGNRQFYDAWNRMVKGDSLGVNGGYEITGFDALGRMIYDPTAGVDLYYNTAGNAVEERQGGSEVKQYVWGLGYVNNLAVVSDGVDGPRSYAHQDANWNITSLTDPSGAVSQRMIYDPYGSETYLTPSWGTGGNYATLLYGFQGGRIQGTFIHFGARSYNPSLGVWMQPDPAGYIDSSNIYLVEGDSPTAYVDPTGLTWTTGSTQWITQPVLNVPSNPPPDGLPWGNPPPGSLAVTIPRLSVTVTCSCCPPPCHVTGIDVHFYTEVYLLPAPMYIGMGIDPAWVTRAEGDHVADFNNWAKGQGAAIANNLERAAKQRSFPSNGDCQTAGHNIFSAIKQAMMDETDATIAAHDTNGKHTWGDPRRRP